MKPRATERPRRSSRRDDSIKTVATEFKEHMDELSGTLSGRLLDNNKKVIKEVTVKDLANSIKDVDSKVKSVVFDGVITQRLVDIASEKAIKNIIGAKIGNVTKSPANLRIASTGQL